jgi:endonuclease YncB( thermonuclease family)
MNLRTLVLALLLMAQVAAFGEDAIRVRVTGVIDGDTINVRDPRGRTATVWIDGIAAPERRQAYAARSKYSLRGLVNMRTILIVPRTIDERGRIVGKVLLGDLDIGLEQVRRGMAWYDDAADFDDSREREAYEDAQERAREERLGLWQAERPVAPWDYRQGHR